MTEMRSQFDTEIRSIQERVDVSTLQIRDLSAQHKALSSEVDAKVSQVRSRQERKQRIINLRRAVTEIRERLPAKERVSLGSLTLGDADAEFMADGQAPPDWSTLNSRLAAYNGLNASLAGHLQSLRSRDSELEAKYRKVVALCINVPEDKVDNVLGQLVTAVESETEKDVGRVREFLKRVEAVTGN
jgi:regulatory protein SWI6